MVWWCGGGMGWLRPILVFSLSLSQAEQYVFEMYLRYASGMPEIRALFDLAKIDRNLPVVSYIFG